MKITFLSADRALTKTYKKLPDGTIGGGFVKGEISQRIALCHLLFLSAYQR